ncbi:uncharacterized protein LOC143746328 [Siphateles boraxobius]|uniref:uncharacterized protein LOC143746328 n=1 Tax=Siphateles boraxobius TaxID=180520 RepID=UPI004063590D
MIFHVGPYTCLQKIKFKLIKSCSFTNRTKPDFLPQLQSARYRVQVDSKLVHQPDFLPQSLHLSCRTPDTGLLKSAGSGPYPDQVVDLHRDQSTTHPCASASLISPVKASST